jgi:hypothetical protein
MSDTPASELIEDLRRSVRLWKALALTLLATLGVVIVLGMGMATVLTIRARQQAEVARQAEMEARQQAERVRQAMEDALREAR